MKLLVAMQHIPEPLKWPLDGLAVIGWVTALFGALTGVVAFVAAVFSMGWAVIRFYETDTVQKWLRKHKDRKTR